MQTDAHVVVNENFQKETAGRMEEKSGFCLACGMQ